MITALGFANSCLNLLLSIVSFIAKNWKETAIGALVVWCVICTNLHCGSKGSHEVTVDTVWVYPDTSAIMALRGFDTIPVFVDRVVYKRWEAPIISEGVDCSDSLYEYIAGLQWCSDMLDECDSLYRIASAIRTYTDTLTNDSIELRVSLKTKGVLFDRPEFTYRRLYPYPVITKTITLNTKPKRGIYLEAGVGAQIRYNRDLSPSPALSMGLGYNDTKANSYGVRGCFGQNLGTVEFTYRKTFGL